MRSLLLVVSFFSCVAAEQEEVLYRSYESGLCLKALTGFQARQHIQAIAALRVSLFKEFPYLYDGAEEYEREYLETYFKSQTGRILLLFDKEKAVGFSNSLLLSEEMSEVRAPMERKGLNLNEYLYIGEALLNPEYRKQNIIRIMGALKYHQARAVQSGAKHLVFMTVDRPEDHLCKPFEYQSLEPIWRHYGFEKMEGDDMKVELSWKQIDTGKEEHNTLSLWCKNI